MIRFANNSVTVVNQVEEAELTVYLAKDSRRALASTSNLQTASVKKFVTDLYASMQGLPKSEYVPLPDTPSKFSPTKGGVDKKLVDAGEELPGREEGHRRFAEGGRKEVGRRDRRWQGGVRHTYLGRDCGVGREECDHTKHTKFR